MTNAEDPATTASPTDNGISKELENLKKSFTQLRSDLTSLVGNALGAGKSGVHVVKDQANAVVDGAKSKLHDLKDKGAESAEAIEQKIADNPLISVLLAFGIGFLLARMFTRK
ncbi:MAG TPA: hypothetical protein VL992_13755 [Tepidisphaeraceae bacterium]|nr:hypothetical protein [Tepidisphaeraceae bacterium]